MNWQEAKDVLRYPESYSEEQVEEASRVVAGRGKVSSRTEIWIFWLSLVGLAAISAMAIPVKRVRAK